MRLTEHIYLAASGMTGMMLTDEWDCNCYLIDTGAEKLLFDCGAGRDPEALVREMEKDGIRAEEVDWLFLTHCHMDHAGAAGYLKEQYGIRTGVLIGEKEILETGDPVQSGLAAAKKAGYYPEDFRIRPCRADRILTDGEKWQSGGCFLEAVAVKGHSPQGCCYHLSFPGKQILITGDMVNASGEISIQVIPGSDVLGYADSMEKLLKKDVDVLLPGHGRMLLQKGSTAVRTAAERFHRLVL